MMTSRFSKPSCGFLLAGLLLFNHIAIAQRPDRSTRPSPGPPPSFTIPPVQHFLLSNGLPMILLEKHQVPIVQINLLIRAGSASDPKGKNGLANMTAAMMMEGAGNRSALALADAIDYLGASITSSSGHHAMAVRLHSPVARLDSALALFADVVLRPTFPAGELARKKKERLTALLQWRDEPRMLSVIAFNRALYGDSHPYGLLSIGSEETLNAFSREDCEKFHALWFHPNNATLIVVGDVDVAVMKPKLEAALGFWKPSIVTASVYPAIEQVSRRQVILVDKPGAAQTEIRIGRIGVPRTTPDFFNISVMNTILGGSFTSRLNNNLREEHGYTYGAASVFDFRAQPGPFLASSAVQTAVTDKALTEFMKELRGILGPVSDLELERGKNYLALSFPGEFQTVGQIAAELEDLVTYNLPDMYFNTYVSNLLAVTREDVQRVARKYIDPEKIVLVLVGDRKVIEEPVKALNLGPIVYKSVEDVLGKPPVIDSSK
jgi:predicted Zn-dependent peptidase